MPSTTTSWSVSSPVASAALVSPDSPPHSFTSSSAPSLASHPKKLSLKWRSVAEIEPLPSFPGKLSSVCVHLQGFYFTSLLSSSPPSLSSTWPVFLAGRGPHLDDLYVSLLWMLQTQHDQSKIPFLLLSLFSFLYSLNKLATSFPFR